MMRKGSMRLPGCLLTGCVLALLSGTPSGAQSLAEQASDGLMRAAGLLEASETAGDRISALTETVRAYETGLQAMRSEVRRLVLQRRELQAKLAAEDADAAALLALMQDATLQTQTRSVLHPGSTPESIRAGMLAQALVPSLLDRATELETVLNDLADTERVLDAGRERLQSGLDQAKNARATLAKALSLRQPLPERLATDEAAFAALIDGADSLAGLSDVLQTESTTDGGLQPENWAWPVSDSAVVTVSGDGQDGWTFQTASAALVTAPVTATIRFAGQVPGFDTIAILEADGGVLVTLAGLQEVFGTRDQIIALGDPLGFMGGVSALAQDKLNADDGRSRLDLNETLYMEIRQAGAPVDPAQVLIAGQE